jgi:hypothetical protein
MEGATSIIEEEFPGEFLHLDSSVSAQDTNNKGEEATDIAKAEDIGIGIENRGTARGGHPVLVPPPLFAIPEFFLALPPLFSLEQLELIFELRSQMEDQLHRDTLMSQRINMLYDAFSNAPTH